MEIRLAVLELTGKGSRLVQCWQRFFANCCHGIGTHTPTQFVSSVKHECA
jgi:hypothetical protein